MIVLQKRVASLAVLFLLAFSLNAQSIKRVTVAGAGDKTGTSWANAMNDSAFRIDVRNATYGDTFWIAEGTYLPDADRDSSIRLSNGVKLFGGFSSSDTTWASRKWQKNATIFSGDIGSAGNNSDNNYHVIYAASVDTSTLIDGLYIQYGYANGSGNNRDNGGGVLNNGMGSGNVSSLQVWHCIFKDNYASYSGGGFCDYGINDGQVASIISNCVFQNGTSARGGGIACKADGGSNNGLAFTQISNCVFVENDASTVGGGIYMKSNNGTIYINNITSTQNTSPSGGFSSNGSTLYMSDGTGYIRNSVSANNPGTDISRNNGTALYAQNMVVEGGIGGGGGIQQLNIINSNPFFVDSTSYLGNDGLWATNDDGLRPKMASPMLGNANDAYLFAYQADDLIGKSRILNGHNDIGAYESEIPCPQLNIGTLFTSYCLGDTVKFQSAVKYGGPNGNYSLTWKANSATVFSGDSTALLSNIYNNDTVYVIMSNTVACNYPNNPRSNGIVVRVDYPYSPYIGGTTCQFGTLNMTGYSATAKLDWLRGSSIVATYYRQSMGYGYKIAGDTFGRAGTDSAYLSSPRGISIDIWGNTYIADRDNAKVTMWMPGYPWGETKAGDKNGSKGNDSNQLNVPVGIYVDGWNNIYVADSGANKVVRWDAGKSYGVTLAGSAAGTSGTDSSKLSGPTGICVKFDGTIYIADHNNNRVQRWDKGMTYGVTVAGSAAGTSGSDSSKLNAPTSVWVDDGGNVYVSDSKNNRIQKWMKDSSYGTTIVGMANGASGTDSVHLNYPTDFVIEKTGTIHVVDQGNNRVQKYFVGNNWGQTVAGSKAGTAGSDSSKLDKPFGLVLDHTGDVHVSDQNNNRVQKWYQEFTMNDYVPDSAGNYTVVMTTTYGCASVSNTETINPAYIPSVTVTPTASNICVGTSVTFNAATINGGTPTFTWKKNGTTVGSNDSTYTDNALNHGDTIICYMKSNVGCATPQTVSDTIIMGVYSVPNASISAAGATTICSSDSVLLMAGTNAAYSYQWYLGGVAINGATDSMYAAKSAGDYTVEVTNPGGCDSLSNTISVIVKTGVNATISYTGSITFCQGDSIVLSGNSGNNYSYQWWMNGSAINGATNIDYTAMNTGDYTVSITDSTSCPVTATKVTVTAYPLPSSTITASGNTAFCPSDSVTLMVTGAASYQWYLNGNSIANATDSMYIAKDSGSYTVMVTNANSCVSTSATAMAVTLYPVPTASIQANKTSICQGDSTMLMANTGNGLTYQWWMGSNAINGATSDMYYANASGDYAVQVSNSNGCMATSSVTTITVNSLPNATANATGSTTICQGDSLQIDATAGMSSYQWMMNGNNISGATSATYYANAAGTYTVMVTNSNSCSATSSGVTVSVNSLPTVSVTPASSTTFCDGGSVVLDATTGLSSYEWQLNGSAISGATAASYTASASGSYTVKVTGSNSCAAISAATVVTANPLPTATITGTNTSFCAGDSAKLDAGSGAGLSYQWMLAGNNIAGATASVIYAKASGSYTVMVTNSNPCSATSTATAVTMNPLPTAPVISKVGNVLTSTVGSSYQWLKGGVIIPGATLQSYTVTAHGSYTVQITDANGCKNTSLATGLNVGLAGIAIDWNISIVPNPSTGQFAVVASGLTEAATMTLYDMAGRMISSSKCTNGTYTFDICDKAAGVYMLSINSGGQLSNHKLIKE